MRRTVRAALLAVLIPVAAAAQEAPRDLVIGITQYPTTLNPNIDSMMAKTYVEGMTLRPFTAYDADRKLVCLLCTELPTFENGRAAREPGKGVGGTDGVALTYTIHPDAAWGDGTPVTTRDVLFTHKVGRHPMSGVGNAELYRRTTAIDVVDAKTFVMHVDRIDFTYNAINDFRLLPAHLDEAIFDADPASYRTRTAFDADPTNPGLAFGPYRLTEVEPGSYLVLEPNPTWWGAEPHFRRIVVRAIENTAALEANLLSGEVDMVAGELGFSVEQALAFEARNGDRFRVAYKPGFVFEHIDLKLDNPVLADPRVRRALMHGMDREAIAAQLFAGRQPVARANISPLDPAYAPDTPAYAFDPDRAGALLDAAGWREMRGGVRHNARGEPLRLDLITTAGNRTRELVQQVVQSMWRGIGVDVQARNQPARVLFGDSLNRRTFTGGALFAWVSSPENVPRSTLHSEEIPSAANGWAGQNYTGYRSPRMDRLLDALEVELDPARRKALWAEQQRLYAEDLPALPLFFRAEPHVWPLWLEGVVPTGHQNPSTLWVERWRAAAPGG